MKMPKKIYNHSNLRPAILKQAHVYAFDGTDESIGVDKVVNTSISALANEDWYKYITNFAGNDLINPYIFMQYGLRPIQPSIIDCYDDWNPADFDDLKNDMQQKTTIVLMKNNEKYKKLFDAMTLEFNPLWNVDGIEETVRTLKQNGTIEAHKTGTDSIAHNGTIANAHTGSIQDTNSETNKTEYKGKESTDYLGKESTEYKGKESTDYLGSEKNRKNGTKSINESGEEVDTKLKATTDSTNLLVVEKNQKHFGSEDVTPSNRETTETYTNLDDEKIYTNRTDEKSFNNRMDEKTYTNRKDEKSYTNRSDDYTASGSNTRQFNDTDTQTNNNTDATTYNSKNTDTYDRLDTERITHTRTGNIGVTKSTDLLLSLIDLANAADFIDQVARDVLEVITISVYF